MIQNDTKCARWQDADFFIVRIAASVIIRSPRLDELLRIYYMEPNRTH